jgi:hypothetical protein
MFYYMYLFSDNLFGQNNDHKKLVNSVTCNYKMAQCVHNIALQNFANVTSV